MHACISPIILFLPGGCEGTRQSNNDNLLALGVLENIDLLGFKVREELEVCSELSLRHDGCLFFDLIYNSMNYCCIQILFQSMNR